MEMFPTSDERTSSVVDLRNPALTREIANLERRIHVLQGLLDAASRLNELNQAVQLASDRQQALMTLGSEPFCYTSQQAQAILNRPVSWQSAAEIDKLRTERSRVTARRDALRDQASAELALHWFG